MIFKDIVWSRDTYNEFINHLYLISNNKYKDQSANIVNTESTIIGNTIPQIRAIAKEISRGDYQTFIKLNTHNTFEETTIHGLIIGYAKIDINETINLLNDFIKYINNWATNDVVVSNLKIFKKEQEIGYQYINSLLNIKDPWYTRFTLVMLLSHYINSEYINRILNICNNTNIDHYYVKMANAWLISMCYVKQKDKTLLFIKDNKLDYWTHNKAIQKIRESYQVSKEDKDMLIAYKKAKE